MEIMINSGRLAAMGLAGITATALPAAAWLIWRKKTAARTFPFAAGIAAYIVISLIRAVMRLIFLSGLERNPPAYFFVMALISGVCEEAGRYILFRRFLENYTDPADAVSCGIGHGGFEVFMVLGIDGISLSSFFLGLAYKLWGMEIFIKSGCDEAETAALMQRIADITVGSSIGVIYECISAMAFHIALSFIVFAAARYGGNRKLLYAAVGIHTLTDYLGAMEFMGIAGTLGKDIVNLFAVAALCYFAYRVYTYYYADNK